MTMTMIVRMTALLAVFSATACGDTGSLGNYDESTGSDTDGTSVSGSGSQSSSMSDSSSMSGSASMSSSASSTTDTDGTMSTSGDPTTTGDTEGGLCGEPGSCNMFPAPCGDTCGTLESIFDEDGCMRTTCQQDESCADGEVCYVAAAFGLCESSGTFCEDDIEEQTCSCGGDPDCGGGHCVPEALYPAAMPGPDGDALVEIDCAPDDGAAFMLTIYTPGEIDGCDATGGVIQLVRLRFYETLAVGTFEFGPTTSSGDGSVNEGVEEQVGSATIEIIEVGETVSGNYTLTVGGFETEPRVLTDAFEAVPLCPAAGPCG